MANMLGRMAGADANPLAELRAYEPTFRDRLATLLIDAGLPETTVEGLMGSRGLGPTQRNAGIGLVDFTPLGIPLAVNEAQKSGQEGDWLGATMNAAAVIPGAKAGTKAIEAGVNEVRQGIRAYHGSPHDFDKFDLSKIGTGEGAQAYGHGLYFAEGEKVARAYRDGLAAPKFESQFDNVNRMLEEEFSRINRQTVAGGDARAAADVVMDRLRQQEKDALKAGDMEWYSTVKDQQAEVARIARDNPKSSGKMYEVSINAHPDEFLDWDKPLSEQPKKVQEAIRSTAVYQDKLAGHKAGHYKDPDSFTGSQWTSFLMDEPDLRSAGAGGPLDQGGLRKFPPSGASASPKVSSDVLKSSGIKGIRYKDAGSRGADKAGQTHNYVVFDDKIIDILKKYGIAGLTAGGVAGMAAGMPTDARAGD